MQLPAEIGQLVVQRPKGLAPFRSCEHVLRSALGHRIVQQREYGHQFRSRLDIEVVHVQAGDDTLRIVLYGLAQFP